MTGIRVIPILLVNGNGLYKTVRFKDPKYVGDPINAIKIFNDKEVDELCVLDIKATREKKDPNYRLIADFASECFMPVCYGGGIDSLEKAKKIFGLGIEKVSLNAAALNSPKLIGEIAAIYGSQAVMVSIDVKKNIWGKNLVYTQNGQNATKFSPEEWAQKAEQEGAGELLINSIEKDGTMNGYDNDLVHKVSSCVKIPIIACGGAGNLKHFKEAVSNGASAVSAGSMFVFHGPHRAVLINFPSQQEIKQTFSI